MKFRLQWWRFNFRFMSTRNYLGMNLSVRPNMKTRGITSRCQDLKHVIFLDYDNVLRWVVEDELRILVEQFRLSPFYLFCSQEKGEGEAAHGNYHAICLTKLRVTELVKVQNETHADVKHRRMWMFSRYKSWVLRTYPKGDKASPRFIGVIGTRNLGREASAAHYRYLRKKYKLPELNYTNMDNSGYVWDTEYYTGVGAKAVKA